jgi:lactoylglutathione lyase
MVNYIQNILLRMENYMKFNWCTIEVRDLTESIIFYEDVVGLKLERRFNAGPDSEIAFLGDGDTKIELIYNKNTKPEVIGANISLGFETSDLDETITFLKSKNIPIQAHPVFGEIISPNPHIKFCYVADPNGIKIQFGQHI